MVNMFSNLSKRDRKVLSYGVLVVITLVAYFFIINPNNKKINSISKQIEKQQQQTSEMTLMAENILSVGGEKTNQKTAEEIISPWFDKKIIDEDKEVIITKELSEKDAKNLFARLVNKGRTKIIKKDNRVHIWHQIN